MNRRITEDNRAERYPSLRLPVSRPTEIMSYDKCQLILKNKLFCCTFTVWYVLNKLWKREISFLSIIWLSRRCSTCEYLLFIPNFRAKKIFIFEAISPHHMARLRFIPDLNMYIETAFYSGFSMRRLFFFLHKIWIKRSLNTNSN